jgi:hypothetical protein
MNKGCFGSPVLLYLCPEVGDWITIADTTVAWFPQESRDVLVKIKMPECAKAPTKWEFWIRAYNLSQTGFAKTEVCSRWLVSMKAND